MIWLSSLILYSFIFCLRDFPSRIVLLFFFLPPFFAPGPLSLFPLPPLIPPALSNVLLSLLKAFWLCFSALKELMSAEDSAVLLFNHFFLPPKPNLLSYTNHSTGMFFKLR